MSAAVRPRSFRPSTLVALALPVTAIVLSAMAWVTAVSRSSFWADDFLNLTHFGRSLGQLSDDHINKGKYVINVFWAMGTTAFGNGSVVPFLLLNTAVFAAGLVLWLRVGAERRWSPIDSWWICGLLIATAAWLPTVLWSSNITHSAGFLALGLGLLAHERCVRSSAPREALWWSLGGGLAWTGALFSNGIYAGLLVLAAYCAWHQFTWIHRLGVGFKWTAVSVTGWNLLLPILYFALIAYPGTTESGPYARNGLKYVHENLHYYKQAFSPTLGLTLIYGAVVLTALAGAVIAARRNVWFPAAVLVAGVGVAVAALIQSQQRFIWYMAMPLLLLFSALAAGLRPLALARLKRASWLRVLALILATVALLLVFRQGNAVRSFFVQTPYGAALSTFRSGVASLTPEAGTICAELNLDAEQQTLLIAEMSGEDGFLVPPIGAARVYLYAAGQVCPATGPTTHIVVNVDARGNFVASS